MAGSRATGQRRKLTPLSGAPGFREGLGQVAAQAGGPARPVVTVECVGRARPRGSAGPRRRWLRLYQGRGRQPVDAGYLSLHRHQSEGLRFQ